MESMNGVQRFVLWDYPRASLQYDIMVALILAFVFITPREWFKDQPKASTVVMLPATGNGTGAFWIEADVLSGVPEAQRPAKATDLLKTRLGHKQRVVRVEPMIDSEQELKGFMAFTGQ